MAQFDLAALISRRGELRGELAAALRFSPQSQMPARAAVRWGDDTLPLTPGATGWSLPAENRAAVTSGAAPQVERSLHSVTQLPMRL